ncbi:phosphoribosylanthranilate isomerase [Alicyclobacillus macrosporangiidus]|uniref:N-(5'-phosphoribosyl)anthranilate isomerase n=1 Tax=Alicyclobacillus macrosporangiidus TaxID=392015 RepID=A0A1I7KTN3_9BACL|nr:phosphoribosylanthranilate isomerase [Alicyclobacillus macrosporangiidus]SFV00800.1 phosphoribosylanthranilate isomerase [Alicyclobacillus macrosporangiidus]
MTVRIKICGLRPGDDLSFADSPWVSHVGFVFVPASRRYVAPESVRNMVAQLEGRAEAVGVFAGAGAEAVRAALARSGIRVAQLHGDEGPEVCDALREAGVQVWKSLSVAPSGEDAQALAARIETFAPHVDALLLDAAPPKSAPASVSGGHGRPFDWRVLPTAIGMVRTRTVLPPLWVAGGIHSGNVGDLLSVFEPDGIDVSSGVETGGRKDPRRIQALCNELAVRASCGAARSAQEAEQFVRQHEPRTVTSEEAIP